MLLRYNAGSVANTGCGSWDTANALAETSLRHFLSPRQVLVGCPGNLCAYVGKIRRHQAQQQLLDRYSRNKPGVGLSSTCKILSRIRPSK